MLNKNLKTFIYDDNEYVLLKKHSCLKKDTTNLITIDSDLDSYILFCGDFHP